MAMPASGSCGASRTLQLLPLASLATQQASHGGAPALRFLLFCLALVPGSYAACAGLVPATVTPGNAPQELLYEADINRGAIVRLAQGDTAWDAMNFGQSREYDCSQLHWGLTGPLRLQCLAGNGGALSADLSGCRLVGCIWHRHALLPVTGPYITMLGAEVDGGGIISTGQWSSMVLAGNGAFYAPPMNAISVLRIEAAGNAATLLTSTNLGKEAMKYRSSVLGPDGRIYAIPYSAPKVLQIDPATDAVVEIGDAFSEAYKWSHAVLAHDGFIYAVPAYATAVLRVDPTTGQTTQISSGYTFSGAMKWSYGIVAANGIIFGIPSNHQSVLRIDPKLGSVSVFGDFGTDARKWDHGLVGIDGRIYGVPSSATAVLRIEPATSTASASLGAGLPAGDFKWSMGVAASDGRIFCIPRSSQQVLMIDPNSGTTSLFGSVSSTIKWKWQYGVFAPDGFIYAIPAGERKVLRIDPKGFTIAQVGLDLGAGLQKYESAALAPSGAIYAAPSSTSRVLRLGPEQDACTRAPLGLNVTCTLGVLCDLTLITPEGKRSALGSLNSVWISPAQDRCVERSYFGVVGYTNPASNSTEVATHSCTFEFGIGTGGVPSTMNRICWAPTSSSQNVVEVGSFALHGPQQNLVAYCAVGLACTITFSGVGLSLGSSLLLIPADELCGSSASHVSVIPGYTNPHNLSSADLQSGTSTVEHHLGVTRTGNSGVYSLCWAQSTVEVTPGSSSYLVPLGQLRLAGPELLESAQSMEPVVCWVGTFCSVSLAGTDLSAANRISVREDCNLDPLAEIAGFRSLVSPDASGRYYSFGTPQEGGRQMHVLCWHHTASSPGVFLRQLQVYGTINGGFSFDCAIGQPCNFTLENSSFYGLPWAMSMQNQLLIVRGSGSACPGNAASLWIGASNPARPMDTVTFFSLGVPDAFSYASTQAVLGDYAVCFSHDGVTFQMNVGILRVLDMPCTVAEPVNSIWPPCLSFDQAGAAVTVMGHFESCEPRCDTHYTPSVTRLACQYGQVVPSTYHCRKSCLRAPYVINGNDHGFCTGLPHGALCSIQCPPGSRKSGDLECWDGNFVHIPGLPAELLFDVPRCYYDCNADACGAGAGLLQHGGKCKAACPDGAAPSVSEVRCIDGTVGPEFTCSRICAEPPDIPHSTGMAPCRDAASGARCNLQCETGYVPSGSPTCRDGEWTSERCIPPCERPVIKNAAPVPCDGLEIITHKSFCKPLCSHGFTPEVDMQSAELSDRGLGLTCDDGVLTPATFICRASCMIKPEVEFAHPPSLQACVGTVHGASCATPCSFGYRKTNDLACINGNFSSATCVKECVEPPQVEYMQANSVCKNLGPGETCEIKCIHGFAPSGVAVCQEGGTYSFVQCERMCFAPAGVTNAMSPSCVEGSAVVNGGTCTANCAPGFTPSKALLACKDGELRPSYFSCQRYCGRPEGIPHARDLSRCATVEVGGMCDLDCAVGYYHTGALRCEADGWQEYFGQTLLGTSGRKLSRGSLVGTFQTTTEFVLAFDIKLFTLAKQHYQSLFHFTATGRNCCQNGDRVPAIFVAPALEGLEGRELHVFLDGGPGCLARDGLQIGVMSHVVISFLAGTLKMTIDGRPLCTEAYDQGINAFTDVSVYGSSPWHEAADAEVRNMIYDPVMSEDSKAQCLQVTCKDLLPSVPGARTDLLSGASCIGAAFNTTCEDVPCPVGMQLNGKFICDMRGNWQSQNGNVVRCVRKTCPEQLPPTVGMLPGHSCGTYKYGDTCAVKCLPGYESSGAYKCTADGTWAVIEGASPACYALSCGDPPIVLHGVSRDVCKNLPSDMLCESECVSGWQPVGEFRCSAQLWTDVPVCVQDQMLEEASRGQKRAIVKGGLAAEPSNDVLDALGMPETWASNVHQAAKDALQKYLTNQLNKTIAVHILGIVGYAGIPNGRLLQANASDIARRWRADLGFLAVPDGPSAADAQALYTSLATLTPGDFEVLLLEMLPGFSRPEAVDVMLSEPRLAEIPALVVDALPELMAQTTTTEGIVVTTTPWWSSLSTSTTNTTTTTTSEGPGYYTQLRQKAYDKAIAWGRIVIWGSVPLAVLLSLFLFYKFMKHAKRYATQVDMSDKRDWNYSIETWTNERVDDGLNPDAIFQYQLEKEARMRQQHLEQVLVGAEEEDPLALEALEGGHHSHGEDGEQEQDDEEENQDKGAVFAQHQKGDAGYAKNEAGAVGSRDHCATSSHWDIRNAKGLGESKFYTEKDAKVNKGRRQAKRRDRRSKTVKMAHEKYLKERTCCQRLMKFTKRFIFICFCGTKIARDLEEKRAYKEGRKVRGRAFGTEPDAQDQQVFISMAERTRKSQRKSVKHAMVMAGMPNFIVDGFLKFSFEKKDKGDLKAAMQKAASEKAKTEAETAAAEKAKKEKEGEEGEEEEPAGDAVVEGTEPMPINAEDERPVEAEGSEMQKVDSELPMNKAGSEMKAVGPEMSAMNSEMRAEGSEKPMYAADSLQIHMSPSEIKEADKYAPEVAEENAGRLSITSSSQRLPGHDGEITEQQSYHQPTKAMLMGKTDSEKELIRLQCMSPEEYDEYQQDVINDFFEFEDLDEIEALKRDAAKRSVNTELDMQAGNTVRILKDQRIDFQNNFYIERVTTRFDVPKRMFVKRRDDENEEDRNKERPRPKTPSSSGGSDINSGDVPDTPVYSSGSEAAKILGYGHDLPKEDDFEGEADQMPHGEGGEGGEEETLVSESIDSDPSAIYDECVDGEEGGETKEDAEKDKEALKGMTKDITHLGGIDEEDVRAEDDDHHHHNNHHHHHEHAGWMIHHSEDEPEEPDHPPEPPTDPKILEVIEKARNKDIYREAMVTERSEAAKAFWGIADGEDYGLAKVADVFGLGTHHDHHRTGLLGTFSSKFWCASPPTHANQS